MMSMDHISAFRDAISAAGITPPDTIHDDGKRHRFSSNGRPRDESGWYILHGDDRPAGAFGCWRSQISATWKHDQPRKEFSLEERKAWAERKRQVEQAREAEIAEAAAYAAKQAATEWASAGEGAHPYLERKQIQLIGARVQKDVLLVPMKHSARELVGLQRIYPDGSKRFIKGTPKAGAYTTLGTTARTGTVVICEGYATGVSIHMATGFCTVVAFDCGNLEAVARKIRAALPEAMIVMAADDDAWTDGNPGRTAATEAARAIGGYVALPLWYGDRPEKHTDFNDLHCDEGLRAVADCIHIAEQPDPTEGSSPGVAPRTAKPASGGENAGSSRGITSGLETAVPENAPDPVILREGGGDVKPRDPDQLLPAASDEFAPNCSDDDLAARHLQRMQQNTLWCEMWGRWLVWNGDRWLRDETNLVLDAVRNSCRLAANVVLENPEMDMNKRQRQADFLARVTRHQQGL